MPPRSARRAAQRKAGAVGFVGNADRRHRAFFRPGQRGLGTMPHALIGYAGSTVRAAEMFHETFPDETMTVLVDYFGREIDRCARGLPALPGACRRRPARRAARHARRPLHRRARPGRAPTRCWNATRRRRSAATATRTELRYLVGTGVSAAAIFHLREALDAAGFRQVKIVATSGFGPAKCRIMAEAEAPIDVVGTGSFLPELWTETYATADIIAYDGVPMVKAGREFLLRKPSRKQEGREQRSRPWCKNFWVSAVSARSLCRM